MGPMIYHHLVLISATTIFLHIRDSLARNFLQVGPTITTFLGTGSFNRIFSTKMVHWGKLMLISQTATFTSNWKYQLLTRMSQAPCMLGGLMLISILAIHFLQAQFNRFGSSSFLFEVECPFYGQDSLEINLRFEACHVN